MTTADAATTIFPTRTIQKANRLIDSGAVRLRAATYYVESRSEDRTWRVTIDAPLPGETIANCDCPFGRRRTSEHAQHCTHATAVLMTLLPDGADL